MHDDGYYWGYSFQTNDRQERELGVVLFQMPNAPFILGFYLWFWSFEIVYERVAPY